MKLLDHARPLQGCPRKGRSEKVVALCLLDPGHCALSAGIGSLFNVLVRQSDQNRLPFAQLICCSLSLKPANSTGRYILHSPPPFR